MSVKGHTIVTVRGASGRVDAAGVIIAGVAAAMISHAATLDPCRNIPTSSDGRPDPGTPAAAYCNAVFHGYDWLLFALIGSAIAFAVFRMLTSFRRSTRWYASVGLVTVLAIANFATASELRAYFGA